MKLSSKLITKILVFLAYYLPFKLMRLQIGDKAPNFKADTTLGELDFYDWSQDQWVILLSHPGDFTLSAQQSLLKLQNYNHYLRKKCKNTDIECRLS